MKVWINIITHHQLVLSMGIKSSPLLLDTKEWVKLSISCTTSKDHHHKSSASISSYLTTANHKNSQNDCCLLWKSLWKDGMRQSPVSSIINGGGGNISLMIMSISQSIL